jgi:hypothetical protein
MTDPIKKNQLFWCSASQPEMLLFLNRIALEIFLMAVIRK